MHQDLSAYFDALEPLDATCEARLRDQLTGALAQLEANWGGELRGLSGFLSSIARRVRASCDAEGQAAGSALAATFASLEFDDLYLAARCAEHDGEAIERLEVRCIQPLDGVIGRVDPSPTFVDDIKQKVRTKLLLAEPGSAPRILAYAGRGPIDAWVRIIAVREAISEKRRSRHQLDSDPELLDVEASVTSPELGLVKQQFRVEFERAFREAMTGLNPEQRNLLRHHYLHGLSFDEIGRIYSLHRSSVARRISKARKTLLAETRRTLAARLATDRAEFEQLLELIASRIDLSIERHLESGVSASS